MSLPRYLAKWRGSTRGSPPRVSNSEVLWSWFGGCIGITLVAWLNTRWFSDTDAALMIGSLGASAVLVYGAVRSPLAQPRNLLGGHMLSALVGVGCWQLLGQGPDLAQLLAPGLAVGTAIALMHLTRTLHPPGGATALIAVIGSEDIKAAGLWYVLVPAGIGPIVLLAVALVVNNLPATRRYPETWW